MHFDLSDEQKMLQESVDSFLSDHSDDTAVLKYVNDEQPSNPLWSGMNELGLAAVLVPESQGGLGMPLLAQAIVAEACGYHGAPGPLLQHSLVALAIASGGSDAQRARWLPRLASGELVGTVAFAEPGSDGRWLSDQWSLGSGPRIEGTKMHVVDADAAGLLLVGLQGGRLGLVEAGDGVRVEPYSSMDRTRRLHAVHFSGASCELLEGASAARIVDAALVLHAADAFGAARRCLDMAVRYAGERVQFGRLIGSFQALKHQLANTAVSLEPCRALYWYAAHAFDAVPEDSPRMAALAKSHIGDVAVRVGRAAVEAHGGIGYTWEYPLHVWLKRAMFDRNCFGEPALHRRRVAELNGW